MIVARYLLSRMYLSSMLEDRQVQWDDNNLFNSKLATSHLIQKQKKGDWIQGFIFGTGWKVNT